MAQLRVAKSKRRGVTAVKYVAADSSALGVSLVVAWRLRGARTWTLVADLPDALKATLPATVTIGLVGRSGGR